MSVKVWNITDVKTPLRDKSIAQPKAVTVFNTEIAPGKTASFAESVLYTLKGKGRLKPQIAKLKEAGLIHIGVTPPEGYPNASRDQGIKMKHNTSHAKLLDEVVVTKIKRHKARSAKVKTSLPTPAKQNYPELSKMSYAKLKEKATAMGLEFRGNISKANISSLISDAVKSGADLPQ